jgi:uncharacterized membrane protein YdjX (TVP38/TMEM64 family)
MAKQKKLLIILLSIFAAATVVLTVLFWPFIKDLQNPEYRERFSGWVTGLGLKGVLILLGIQMLQIIVAVIPGGPIELIAGAAYGAWGGLGVCLAGSIIASALIFSAVRKFGIPLLHLFFKKDDIAVWSFLKNTQKAALIVFILFLIPGMPKDMLTWVAPLSALSLPLFLCVSSVGRIPAMLSTAIMGDSMIQGNWLMTLLLFLIIAAAGLLGIWLRGKLLKKLQLQ